MKKVIKECDIKIEPFASNTECESESLSDLHEIIKSEATEVVRKLMDNVISMPLSELHAIIKREATEAVRKEMAKHSAFLRRESIRALHFNTMALCNAIDAIESRFQSVEDVDVVRDV